ncbi:MAG: TetR/AcrR family transcriptional regulator [Lysobacteraceae bacterium]
MPARPPAAAAPASPRRPRRRAPGRPSGDGVDLRGRLLDAAVGRFARDGIAGSSLRDIARDAGTTPALVHYYFGNRDALLEAVIEERLMPVMQTLRMPVLAAGDDLRAIVRGFVRAVLGLAMAHPWLPQLWVREVLHEGGGLRTVLFDRVGPLLPQLLAARFAQAQAAGQLNPRLDPRLLVPSLVGQTMFLAASAPIWRGLFDAQDIDTDALCAHVLALLESGLELPA